MTPRIPTTLETMADSIIAAVDELDATIDAVRVCGDAAHEVLLAELGGAS